MRYEWVLEKKKGCIKERVNKRPARISLEIVRLANNTTNEYCHTRIHLFQAILHHSGKLFSDWVDDLLGNISYHNLSSFFYACERFNRVALSQMSCGYTSQ
jgi:hypothetical protein